MAKVIPGANLPGRTKSLRGVVYFRTCRGIIMACKWPRPRGRPKTEQHRHQVEWFTQAQKLAKRVDAKTQTTIAQAFASSPLMPRDVATSLMAGRMYSVQLADGRWIRSKRAMSDVSQSLDLISNTPGRVLVRGQKFWQGVPLPSEQAAWIQPGVETAWTRNPGAADAPFKGSDHTPHVTVVVSQIGVIMDAVPSGEYRGLIAPLDANRVVQEVHLSPIVTTNISGRQLLVSELEVTLEPGQRYAIMFGRVDQGDSHNAQIAPIDGVSWPWPGRRSTFATLFKASPQVGDQVGGANPGMVAVAVRALF